MYLNVNNLNVSGSEDSACSTVPRTPEILNSLIALTNPFDTSYASSSHNVLVENAPSNHYGSRHSPPLATSPSDAGMAAYPSPPSVSSSSGSSTSSPGPSPIGHRMFPPPRSIQHTRSQLIKEGLKLTIQSKRMASGQNNVPIEHKIPRRRDELTPEDNERRRRRRERNKIAATKCRNKKKEKTVILVQESECMEGQNVSLKTEIQKLEAEKQRLMDILSMHAPSCNKNGTPIKYESSNNPMGNNTIVYDSEGATENSNSPVFHCHDNPVSSPSGNCTADMRFSNSCNYDSSPSGRNSSNSNFLFFSSENNCVAFT